MSSEGGCRPVASSHRLQKGRPATSGLHIPGPPRPTGVAQPIALPALAGAGAAEIRARVRHLHFETVPDWSGSTFSVWGGDPNDVIGAVTISVFLWLRRHGGGTAGVVPWGTTPATHLALGPLSVKKNLKALKAAIRDRVNLGGNDLPAALRLSADRTSDLPAHTVPFYWVPTDGIESVTSSTHDAVNALPPGSVHLVLIDPLRGCTPEMQNDWRSVPFGSITRIDDLSVRNVATTIAERCAAAIGLQLVTATPATSEEKEQSS
ncbi:hypothetical protein [Arthrobacter sp. 31Y]|uniref:hypothetical protein n=1 Tax=Arthrobacter sp. 31Y TaxID=1115632 RepID=UPI0004655027|nr:hypothetical protein [Arthrobacter sp. 31Y]